MCVVWIVCSVVWIVYVCSVDSVCVVWIVCVCSVDSVCVVWIVCV